MSDKEGRVQKEDYPGLDASEVQRLKRVLEYRQKHPRVFFGSGFVAGVKGGPAADAVEASHKPTLTESPTVMSPSRPPITSPSSKGRVTFMLSNYTVDDRLQCRRLDHTARHAATDVPPAVPRDLYEKEVSTRRLIVPTGTIKSLRTERAAARRSPAPDTMNVARLSESGKVDELAHLTGGHFEVVTKAQGVRDSLHISAYMW